jgi:hypothetical protein
MLVKLKRMKAMFIIWAPNLAKLHLPPFFKVSILKWYIIGRQKPSIGMQVEPTIRMTVEIEETQTAEINVDVTRKIVSK